MLSSVEVTVAFRIWSVGATQAVLSCLVEANDNADFQWLILRDRVSREETSPYHPSRSALHGLRMGISSASVSGTSVALRVWAKIVAQATLVSPSSFLDCPSLSK